MKKTPISLLVLAALLITVLVFVIINIFPTPDQQKRQVVIDLPEPQQEKMVDSKLASYESATPHQGNTYADYLDELEQQRLAADTINQHLQKLITNTVDQSTVSSSSAKVKSRVSKSPGIQPSQQYQQEIDRLHNNLEQISRMESNLDNIRSNIAQPTPTTSAPQADVDNTPKYLNLSEMYANNTPTTTIVTGFNTPISSTATQVSTKQINSRVVKVIVVQSTKVESTGQKIIVRTLEPFCSEDGCTIARNTHISIYVSSISDDRIRLKAAHSINNNSLQLEAYDIDGSLGLYCPNSTASKTTKEIADAAVDAATSAIGGIVGFSSITNSAANLAKPKSISIEIVQGFEFYLVKI